MGKQGSSFGTTIAVLGSTLIAVGIAWLIAQNWHQLSAALKIIILLAATALAYTAGVVVRLRGYVGVGKGLIVLGGLLYTLSVFLIAQIFSTETSLQGTALLILLSWIGVLIASYAFDTAASMVVALAEFLIWMNLQYFAFFVAYSNEPSLGLLALIYLFGAALFYGLSLWHRAKEHEFSKLFQWCTVFYLMGFTYLLSFQTLLPNLWPSGADYPMGSIVYLVVLAIVSLVVLLSGMSASSGKTNKKEITWFWVAFILLAVLISAASFVSQTIGTCSPRSCYDYKLQSDCGKAPASLNCQWKDNYCIEKDCYRLTDKATCEQEKCRWVEEGRVCQRPSCYYEHRDKETCDDANVPGGCEWYENTGGPFSVQMPTGTCREKNVCGKQTERLSCMSNEMCKWGAYSQFGFMGQSTKAPLSLWAVWIFANIVLLVVILGVIFYGTWQKLPKVVNIGVAFFSLDIITRYIGFIMDLRGYMSLSLIFITGGIILLLGGWFLERWRRNLVRQAKGKQ